MSRRTQFIGAGVVAGIGLIVLLVVFFSGSGSVREYVDDNYRRTKSSDPALKGARVYSSPKAASDVTEDIAEAWKPAERHVDPAAYFLRYRNDIVVVSPAGSGSRIVIDSQERGYARWYPFIGGYWGTYTSPGGDVRGGGPGAGK